MDSNHRKQEENYTNPVINKILTEKTLKDIRVKGEVMVILPRLNNTFNMISINSPDFGGFWGRE